MCAGQTIITEAKAYTSGSPSKSDICTFDRKTFDLYVARRRQGVAAHHWRLLGSATPVADDFRRYCFLYGIIVIDPALIPLPMLLRVASHPQADDYFADQLLAELVRLGEAAASSLERRYVPDGPYLRLDIRVFGDRDLDDLLWLQRTLSAELLDLVDRERPGHYEGRAEVVLATLGIPAMRAGAAASEHSVARSGTYG